MVEVGILKAPNGRKCGNTASSLYCDRL